MKKKQALILLLVAGLILLAQVYDKYMRQQPIYVLSPRAVDGEPAQEEAPEKQAAVPVDDRILVHVEGQVVQPGVYELRTGDRVQDAVEAAGGLTDQADRSRINLAKRVYDEELVYLPAQGEVYEAAPTGGKPGTASGKVNINRGDAAELATLPGIGEALAGRIIAYRQEKGDFKMIEELMNVSGIGEKKFEALKSLITVE